MSADAITPERIAATYALIQPFIRRTPFVDCDAADFGLGGSGRISFKLELCQHAGSFKTRGAFANLLTREVPAVGVVAASGGNHGAAVAYAAMKRGVRAKIFVPTISSPAKVQRIRDFGADVSLVGERYAEALAASIAWQKESGALAIHAFDQTETLLGQGTLALEFEQQAGKFDAILVGVGGGGLIGGIAAWHRRATSIIGVEPELAPTLTRALAAGRPVDAEAGGIAADSLAPARVGELVFPIARDFVERVILVSDSEIRAAQNMLWKSLRIVAEPGGSAAFAALLSGKYTAADGARVGVVVSGGNTVAVDFGR